MPSGKMSVFTPRDRSRLLLHDQPGMQPDKRRGAGSSSAAPAHKVARLGSAQAARPGGAMSNLLGEAMKLSSRTTSLVRRPQPDGGPRVPTGAVVKRLPLDLGLKKDCVVTSPATLKWCSSACPAAQAKAIAADGSGTAEQLHRALAHWRYPAQRLPTSLVKQLSAPGLPPAEAAHASGLRNDWAVRPTPPRHAITLTSPHTPHTSRTSACTSAPRPLLHPRGRPPSTPSTLRCERAAARTFT